ncbi:MAG: methyltransferase protein [Polaromonas sp.]|nr:methyltransferase protein [Polaromonas sp.]
MTSLDAGSTMPSFERARQLFLEGVTLFESDRLPEARAAFEASLQLLPGRVSTLGNLAATHIRLGAPMLALPLLDEAIASEPDAIDPWLQLGLAQTALERHEEALAAFERVLKLSPANPPAAYQRCLRLATLQRYPQALQAVDRLHQLEPGNEQAWWLRADILHRLHRLDEALQAYDQLLRINPQLARAWTQRGGILKDMGRTSEAQAAFTQALALGGDADINRYFLASLADDGNSTGPTPDTAPRSYVESLFDDYADNFDAHLVGQLGYRAHRVLVEHLLALPAVQGRVFATALDLGCGTGLCGPLIRPHARRLLGIDLSAQMLAKARLTGAYDELAQADLLEHLNENTADHALVLSADVFIYVGALDGVFAGMARALEPDGMFCFSVEKAPDDVDFKLTRGMRYAHSERYLRALAAKHAFTVLDMLNHPIRQDQQRAIDGLFVYLSR